MVNKLEREAHAAGQRLMARFETKSEIRAHRVNGAHPKADVRFEAAADRGGREVAAVTAEGVEGPCWIQGKIPAQVKAVTDEGKAGNKDRTDLAFDPNGVIHIRDESAFDDLFCEKR